MTQDNAPRPRIIEPDRSKPIVWEIREDSLPASHPARVLWDVLGLLDLSEFMQGVKAVEGRAGRSALGPRMLLTLWLFAISQGISSAREIVRLTHSHVAYRWIVGNCNVCHDKLSAFRVGYARALDRLFTDVIGTLLNKELITLDLAAQDGTRTRASASAASFRTEKGLQGCREQAALHLKAVLADVDNPELTKAQVARRIAAAKDFQRRVEDAVTTVKQLELEGKDEPRASTTDAEARKMKMPDGGFRPGYNIQTVTVGSALGGPRTVVAISVTNLGSDMGSLVPMMDQVQSRTGQLPKVLLADTNHAKHSDIEELKTRGVRVLIPPLKSHQDKGTHVNHSPQLEDWRQDMQTEEAKQLYRARASLCELENAQLKAHQGFTQVLVRGMGKVLCAGLLCALSSNLLQHAAALLQK